MMKKSNIKRLALSAMAASLVLVSAVGVTYSWIDDVKMVEFRNDSVTDNNAPLKTGVDINASINITSKENTINLGNILSASDTTYQYQEDGTTKNHIRYDTASANAAKNPKWNSSDNSGINEKKGYFYESGGMHLSGCYGDGETFYFPQRADATDTILGYRVGNKDDENVNYISFTAKVSSPDANVDFWFKQEPSVKVHGQDSPIDHARYAITVDGQSHVYSSTGSAQTCNAAMDGLESVSGVRKTAVYTYNNEENTTAARGKNSNTLFSIKKGATVLMNVKIWMEDGFDANAVDVDFQLVSSWTDTRKIHIVDRTTNNNGASWIRNNNAKLFLTCPEILNAYAKEIYTSPSVANWSSISSNTAYSFASVAPFYELTLDSGSTDSYTANVPLAYNNEDLVLYRCDSTGWNIGTHTGNSGDYGVTYWNWWKTTLPNSYKDETYTLYGSSLDDVAKEEFPADITKDTYKGYGTWGAVEEIHVYSHYSDTDYATKNTVGDGSRLFVRDHSDEDTSQEIYTYVMYREDNDTNSPWKVYIPASSSKIQFYYHLGDAKATWGYKSWGGENPQRRPLQSTGLYANNSTVYHFCRYYGGDKGWGYWEGADTVYLIKSNFLSSSGTTAHAYMFDSGTGTVFLKVNSEWTADSAQFAAYFWKDSNNSGDVRMTKISSDTYMAVTPTGSWDHVMFKRYNSDYSSLWNQTVDLDYNGNVNGRVYTLTGKVDNQYNGSWSNREKSAYSGETLTRLTNVSGANVSYSWDGNTAEVWKTESPCVYGKIIFNNGFGGDDAAVGVNKTGNLNLFPGCFYQVDGSKWYGSLDDKGRDASTTGGDDSGGGGGTDQGGGTIDGYTESTDFTVQIAGQTYNVKTNGTDFKVEVTMAEGANWTTFQKNGTNFGNEKQGQSYDAKSNMDLYLSNSYRNNVNIRTQSAGSFIISFKWENDNTIKITSTLKKS